MSATTTLRMVLLGEDKSAGKALRGVGDDAEKTSKKMQTFHKVGTAAGVALAGGLVLAGKAAVDMTKKAAADEQAASRLSQTLHKAAGATDAQVKSMEDWITAQGKAKGVTDDELRPALSKLAAATHSVSKAQKLAGLAMDVSAGSGKSLETVSSALQKAVNGNTTGLSRLGIQTKNADGSTKSLHQVTKDLAATYGGAAAKNAETAAGKQKILTNNMNELQEKIGYALIPVMDKLVDVGMKVVDWIDQNTKLAGILVASLGGLLAIVAGVSAATKVWTAVSTIANAATKVWAAGQWLLNAAMSANPIALVVIAIAALVTGLIIAYKKSETFRKIVNAAFHGVQVAVGAVVGFITDHWELLLILLTGGTGAAVVLIVKNFGKVMAAVRALGGWAKWLWNSVFQPVFKFIVNGIGTLLSMWAGMLHALAHVPGFGWAGDLADKLDSAAGKAHALANAIVDIPTHKTSTVVLNVVHNVVHTTGGRVPGDPGMGGGSGGGAGRAAARSLRSGSGGGAGGGGDLGTVTVDLQQDGRSVQKVLLKLKRENGGLALGLA